MTKSVASHIREIIQLCKIGSTIDYKIVGEHLRARRVIASGGAISGAMFKAEKAGMLRRVSNRRYHQRFEVISHKSNIRTKSKPNPKPEPQVTVAVPPDLFSTAITEREALRRDFVRLCQLQSEVNALMVSLARRIG